MTHDVRTTREREAGGTGDGTGGGATAVRTSGSATRRVLSVAAVFVLVLAACALLVGRSVAEQTQLSPLDEYVYADYLDKVEHLGLAQRGETFDTYTMSLGSCRGVAGYGRIGSPCGGPYRLADAPYGGVTSADIHPPTYFALTALVASAEMATGATHDLLTAGRMAGALWLAVGVCLTALLARRLGAPWLMAVLAGGIVVVAPATKWSNTYVTPDALNIACGAAVALVGLRVASGRSRGWLLLVVAALVASVKAQNVLAVGVVGLMLVLTSLRRREAGPDGGWLRWRPAVMGVLAVVVGVATQVVWMAYRSLTALGPPADQQLGGEHFRPTLLVADAVALMRGAVVGPMGHVSPLGEAVGWVTVAGVLGTIFVAGLATVSGRLATATFVGLVVGGPALSVLAYLLGGSQFPTQPRYGMSVLAIIAALVAGLIRVRWVAVLGLVAVVASYLLVVVRPGLW